MPLMNVQWLKICLILCLLVGVLAGCNGDSDSDDTPEPDETAVVTPDPEETAAVTPEPTEEAIATEEPTSEITVTLDRDLANRSATENGEFYIAVSNVVETDSSNNAGDAPDGSRWIEVNGTLGNESDSPVTVEAEHLALVDEDGNLYAPEPPLENEQPSFVGSIIQSSNSVTGLVRFAVPDEVVPVRIEWCFDGTCDEVIQFEIDLSSNQDDS